MVTISDVPLVSVRGPLLFLIWPNIVCSNLLYADDYKLYRDINDIDE